MRCRISMSALLAALALVPLVSLSCSGGGGGGSGGALHGALSISGTWKGTWETSLFPQSEIAFNITQAGNEISGTYSGENASGSFSGTLSGPTITFDLDPSSDCPGDFDGTGKVAGPSLTLTFTGTDCLGNHRNGRASLMKQ